MIDARKIARYGEDVWLGQVCSDESGSAAGDKSESTSPMPPWISPVRYAKWVPATKKTARLRLCDHSAVTTILHQSCSQALTPGQYFSLVFRRAPKLAKRFLTASNTLEFAECPQFQKCCHDGGAPSRKQLCNPSKFTFRRCTSFGGRICIHYCPFGGSPPARCHDGTASFRK